MKITVIQKKNPRKPQNFCPWAIDEATDPGPDKR